MDLNLQNIGDLAADGQELDLARIYLYRLLSLALSDPKSARFARLRDEPFAEAATAAADFLREEPTARPNTLAPGELPPDAMDVSSILALAARPHADCIEDFERTFGLMVSKKCPPHESEYCRQTFAVYRTQHMADIAGFYRAFGLEPSRDMPERADHLALELEFMAWLISKRLYAMRQDSEQARINADVCREAQTVFVRDHLAWWAPAFAHTLRQCVRASDPECLEAGASPFYGAVAACLAAFIAAERAILGIDPPKELSLEIPAVAGEEDVSACHECSAATP